MNSNIADPMHFCACIFISLYMHLHTGDALFMKVGKGKWEKNERGSRTSKFVHPTLIELFATKHAFSVLTISTSTSV